MISFNHPPYTGNEDKYVLDAMKSLKISGDGAYSKKCQNWFEENLGCPKTLLTPSCTHALEMAAMLISIKEGDEVIMPSYTFVSTATAFVLRGAKVVFVDIEKQTMNIDSDLIEAAITDKTKAIVPVHYAGVGCNMDKIMSLAEQYGLYIIEDAAQGMKSLYKNKPLGTIGHLGTYSFHETKNYTSGGEGGLLLINDKQFIERAEILREKGTNRNQFFRGMVDKYSWVDIGSSYLPSELQAAYLWAQLEQADIINENRLETWNFYNNNLSPLAMKGKFEIPYIPTDRTHNAHMFYIKLKDIQERTKFINFMKENNILTVFHYIPLHSSIAGMKYGIFNGEDKYTTVESEKLVRLPMWFDIKNSTLNTVVNAIYDYFNSKRD
jgi:dTDP-4-amino-4,6-dideoxygalactose transaminase